MKFLPTLLFSLSILIIPLSSQQQTLSLEHAVSQDVNKQLLCMAKNIYHEAATESKLGKYAVAQVTINRTKDPRFEDGICEVVLEPYQFSWANNRRMQWTTPRGSNWEESKRIARDVIVEGKRVHGMHDVLFYHADYVRPYWARAKRRLAQIGAHIFYEPRV